MKQALTLDQVIAALNNYKGGRFHKLSYYSKPKTIDGSTIYKVTETTVRMKVNEKNCKGYAEPTTHRNENSTYIVDKVLKYNNKTENYLLKIFPIWSRHKSYYLNEQGNEISNAEALAVIKPHPHSDNLFITANALQILSI